MRACSSQLAARLAGETTTLARLWRVVRADGSILRFTDAVRPITITVGTDGPQTYRADVSFTCSAIFTSKSFANQQNVTITVIMDDTAFAEKDLRSRLYDGAVSDIYVCDYLFPQYGVVSMFNGIFGRIQLSDQHVATIEVTPTQSTINGTAIGADKYQQTCRANLFDAKCGLDKNAFKVTFTVASASAGSIVSANFNQANEHWALGFIKWLTGPNAGSTSKVQSNDLGSTSVFLLSAPFFAALPGDTGEIYPGCDKLRKTCLEKYNDVINFRGEPDVPDAASTAGRATRSDLIAKYIAGL